MHYFITNREVLIDQNGNEYLRSDGKEKASPLDNLRFGAADAEGNLTLFPEPQIGDENTYNGLQGRNNTELFGSKRFFKSLYDDLIDDSKTKRDVLFFIHGFNTDLEGVKENIRDLHQRYVENPDSPIEHIVVFTWPGRSPKVAPLHYHDDRKDAIRSGEALARGFEKLLEFFKKFLVQDHNTPCERKIHLMLHSMGHRVFKHTMMELGKKDFGAIQPFEEIFCMAGDVDYKIFEQDHAFYNLIDFGSRVHIYYHKKDRALDISKYTKNFSNRLGRYGRRSHDNSFANIFDVDVTTCVDDEKYGLKADQFNHWYYYTSTEVVNRVIRTLNEGDR